MQRDGRRRPRELVNDGAILELVEDVAWLALAGEAGETRPTGAYPPGRGGDTECGDLVADGVYGDAAPVQMLAERLIVALEIRLSRGVLLLHQPGVDHMIHGSLSQRVKAWALPASTLTILPVDFADMSETRKYTASATSCG